MKGHLYLTKPLLYIHFLYFKGKFITVNDLELCIKAGTIQIYH